MGEATVIVHVVAPQLWGEKGRQPYAEAASSQCALSNKYQKIETNGCFESSWPFSKEQYRFNCMLFPTPLLQQRETCNKSQKPYRGLFFPLSPQTRA